MSSHPLRALVGLELRRGLTPAIKMFGFVGAVVLLMGVTGWATHGRLSFVLALAGFSAVTQIPANALRDRMDGGLEFLKGLPVEADTLAASRLITCGVAAVPGAALVLAAALEYAGNLRTVTTHPLGIVGAGVLAWAGLTAGSALVTALLLRIQVSQAGYIPLAFVVGLAALDPLLDRMVPHPTTVLHRILRQPWLPEALWVLVAASCALAVAVAFVVARTGIRTFTPGRDRMTW